MSGRRARVRVGPLEAGAGQHTFGFLPVGRSRSGLSADIPAHLFVGTEPGPVLLVQAAVHGTEVVGTAAVLRFVKTLDPRRLRGSIIAIPVLNRLGFERDDRFNPVDGKDISRLFPGDPRGSLSQQIAHVYFHEVIRQADVLIDLHAAARGYERYILYPADASPETRTVLEESRRRLILAFGLDTAAFFPAGTFGTAAAEAAIAGAGVVMFQPEIGGGAGWFVHGEENVRDIVRGIRNTMRAMRMVDDPFAWDGPRCTIYNACVVFWKPPQDGLLARHRGMGDTVARGEIYATIQDPYRARLLAELRSPRDARVLPSGLEWPSMSSTTVGILGIVDRVEDRSALDLFVDFA